MIRLLRYILSLFRPRPRITHTSVRDGNWFDPETWDTHSVPSDGDATAVRHNVYVDGGCEIQRAKDSFNPVNPDFKSNITWTKSDPPEDGSVIEQDDVSYRLRDTEKDDRKYHDR